METLAILISVIFLDICLSGDNVVVIAMAAQGLSKEQQNSALTVGMIGACALRIVLSLAAIWLMHWTVIQIVGGALLLWVAKNLLLEILPKKSPDDESTVIKPSRDLPSAIATIIVADLSMSLDNILAVASIAQAHPWIMALGFILSIAIIAVGSKLVVELLEKLPWINWVGLLLIVLVACRMIWTGITATLPA